MGKTWNEISCLLTIEMPEEDLLAPHAPGGPVRHDDTCAGF